MPGNNEVIALRQLSMNCLHFAGTMGGLVMTGFNWSDIRAIADSAGIIFDEITIKKMRVLEDQAIYYLNKGGEQNG